MEYEFFLINAFTNSPFSGNGAGVCLLKTQQGQPEVSDILKQKLAAEINLSETAFVSSYSENQDFQKESRFSLRWFTPKVEVPLCGHATLASAAALFYHIGNTNEKLTFDTMSGPLVAERGVESHQIRMELPWKDTTTPSVDDEVHKLVKVTVGNLPVKDVRLGPVGQMVLIRLDDSVTRAEFEKLSPVGEQMKSVYNDDKIIGVIVTLKGSATNGCVDEYGTVYDFVSRFFAPWSGIDEDPVTGSSHAILGPYWAPILAKKHLFACQASKRRGELWLHVKEPGTTVAVTGQFFTYLTGHVRIQ